MELLRQGYKVTVVALGESSVNRLDEHIEEHIIKSYSKPRILKHVFIWPTIIATLLKVINRNSKYDQVIMFAPLSVMWPAAFIVRFISAAKKTAVIFDIYPVHQVKIGAIPSLLERPLKSIELWLFSGFTEFTAMGEYNRKYIKNYYFSAKNETSVKILNLWGRGIHAKFRNSRHDDVVRAVFGGQITKGRDFNALLVFFEKLRSTGLALELDIYSHGADYDELKKSYSRISWIKFKGRMPREEYFDRLPDYDVGIIVTDQKADLPTFPSKIVDYIEAGLRTYCLVERESELYSLLGKFDVVYINPFRFDAEEVSKSAAFLNGCRDGHDGEQFQKIRDLFSAKTAVHRLTA